MAYSENEYSHDRQAREHRQDQPSFRPSVVLESSREVRIGQALILAAPYKLGESVSPDTVEVSGTRAPQRLIDLWMPLGKGVSELPPPADRSPHQNQGTDQPAKRSECDRFLEFHAA
jgi:hypothetical protein